MKIPGRILCGAGKNVIWNSENLKAKTNKTFVQAGLHRKERKTRKDNVSPLKDIVYITILIDKSKQRKDQKCQMINLFLFSVPVFTGKWFQDSCNNIPPVKSHVWKISICSRGWNLFWAHFALECGKGKSLL